MELTRRDALAALTLAGGAVAGGTALAGRRPPRAVDADAPLETLTAAAEVLYPSEASGHRPFVETYVLGRAADDDDRRAALERAVLELDELAREWEGAPFADLSRTRRDGVLRQVGVTTADPDPEGTTAERLRRFVVNELLFAFYASPAGGRLVGIENPIGYPGGTESYRRASPLDPENDG